MGEAARAGSRQAQSGMFMAVELFEAEPCAQESVVWLDSFHGERAEGHSPREGGAERLA